MSDNEPVAADRTANEERRLREMIDKADLPDEELTEYGRGAAHFARRLRWVLDGKDEWGKERRQDQALLREEATDRVALMLCEDDNHSWASGINSPAAGETVCEYHRLQAWRILDTIPSFPAPDFTAFDPDEERGFQTCPKCGVVEPCSIHGEGRDTRPAFSLPVDGISKSTAVSAPPDDDGTPPLTVWVSSWAHGPMDVFADEESAKAWNVCRPRALRWEPLAPGVWTSSLADKPGETAVDPSMRHSWPHPLPCICPSPCPGGRPPPRKGRTGLICPAHGCYFGSTVADP